MKTQTVTIPVHVAATEADLRRCYPVMKQLRPPFTEDQFVAAVQRMHKHEGYAIAFTEHDGKVAACAGFRYTEMLHRGFSMYVDDLITDENLRSGGHGHALMEWLRAQARAKDCQELHLDSGVQRFDAHRFYFRERMYISSYHFREKL